MCDDVYLIHYRHYTSMVSPIIIFFGFMFCLWSSTPERRCLVLRCAAKAQVRTPHSNPGVKNAFSSWTLFKSYSDSIRGCCAIENVSRVLKEI